MDGLEGRHRPTIEERAARRDEIERRQADRYSSLLHTLRGGREIDLRRRRGRRLRWHPIAGTLLQAAVVAVGLYLVATTVIRVVREGAVETWTGPGATVTSGQELAGCAAVSGFDSTFPRWVRYDGRVFRATDFIRPVGFAPSESYPETGYALGDLRLLLVANTPDGLAGRQIVLKLTSVATGALYEVTDCQ